MEIPIERGGVCGAAAEQPVAEQPIADGAVNGTVVKGIFADRTIVTGTAAGTARRRGLLCFRAGYRPAFPLLYRAWNLALVIPLIISVLLLMAIIATILFFTQGREILYCGPRLGKDKRIFNMYKFRTLNATAGDLTKDRVLPRRSQAESLCGNFLRLTRLDELPQLFNVLKGDMNLFGPRPVRPEIAKICAASLRHEGYDIRFRVRPGMIGYSQCLLSHGTSKAIRNRVNRPLCRESTRIGWEALLIARTGVAVLLKSLWLIGERLRSRWMGVRRERRHERRISPYAASVTVIGQGVRVGADLLNINDEMFVFETPANLEVSDCRFVLSCGIMWTKKRKQAKCHGQIEKISSEDGGGACRDRPKANLYRARYHPDTDFQNYIVDRYFLHNSLLF